MRKILVTIVFLFALMPLMAQNDVPAANYRVVPLPQQNAKNSAIRRRE